MRFRHTNTTIFITMNAVYKKETPQIQKEREFNVPELSF